MSFIFIKVLHNSAEVLKIFVLEDNHLIELIISLLDKSHRAVFSDWIKALRDACLS